MNHLTESEIQVLTKAGRQEGEVDSINRDLDRRLKHRQRWINPTRIMLIGEAGVGKSALRDLLLGNFEAGRDPVTKVCEEYAGTYREEDIVVVDTPGGALRQSNDTVLDTHAFGYGATTTETTNVLKELRTKMDGIDVFILVLNSSYIPKRDLGIKSLRELKVINDQSIKHFMVVATHSQAHYSDKGVDAFLTDMKQDPLVKDFFDRINNRVVLVEMGLGPVTVEAARRGMPAVYNKERKQGRDMVMKMVHKVTCVDELSDESKKIKPHIPKPIWVFAIALTALVVAVISVFVWIVEEVDGDTEPFSTSPSP